MLKKINLLSLIVSTVLINLARIKLILGSWDLALAKELAKMLSGKIGFSEELPVVDTTFFLVTLPIK